MTKKEAHRLKNWLNDAPKTIRVGPEDYSVTFVQGWIRDPGVDKNFWGRCDSSTYRITVAVPEEINNPRPIAATLWHEILHALWYIAQLGPKAKEEEAIQRLEFGSVAFIRDNPHVMKWLLKGLK